MGASQSAADASAGAAASATTAKSGAFSVSPQHQISGEVQGAACTAVVGVQGPTSCIFALRVGPMAPKFKEHYVRMIGEAFDRPPTSKRGFARAILRGQLQLLVRLGREGARAEAAGEGSPASASEVFVEALRLLSGAPGDLHRLTRGVVKCGALQAVEDAGGASEGGGGGAGALEAAAEHIQRTLLRGDGPWTDPRGMGSIATPGTALASEPDSVPAPSLGTVTAADAKEVVSKAADRGLKWSKAQSQALVSVTYFGVVQAEFWAQVCFPRVRNAVSQLVARVAEVSTEMVHSPRRLLNVVLHLMGVSARLDTYEEELKAAAAAVAASVAGDGGTPATGSASGAAGADGATGESAANGAGTNGPSTEAGASGGGADAVLSDEAVRGGLLNVTDELRVLSEGSLAYGACGILGLQKWIVGEAVLRFKATVLDVMGLTPQQTAEANQIEKDATALQASVCLDQGSTSLGSLCAELAWLRERGIPVRAARAAAERVAKSASAAAEDKHSASEAAGGEGDAAAAAATTAAPAEGEAEAKEDGAAEASAGDSSSAGPGCSLTDEEVTKHLPSLVWVVGHVGSLLAPASTRLLDLVQSLLDKVLEERRMAAEAYADLMSACANNKEQAALVFDRVMAWGKDLNGFPSNLAYNILISCARSHDDLIAAINRMTALGAPMDSTICERVLRRYQGKPYTYYDLWALIQHNKEGFPDLLKNHKALSCFSFRFGPQCTSQEIIQIALRDHLVAHRRRDSDDDEAEEDR
mmetsp:Transcript_4849/g.15694  ORF Transcript_4849/g.15694 Transcript_4849/m.15694 type:complete len:758 (-) Transcript_4849:71-2344(-)